MTKSLMVFILYAGRILMIAINAMLRISMREVEANGHNKWGNVIIGVKINDEIIQIIVLSSYKA